MCCCGKPIINGQHGYRWQPNDAPSIYPANPPDILPGDTLLFDEPGRCGEIDSHSFHYRVVDGYGCTYLLVRHGGGDERFVIRSPLAAVLSDMDSNARYWLLNGVYHTIKTATRATAKDADEYWRRAAAEKRIKTRKMPRSTAVKVWIVPAAE